MLLKNSTATFDNTDDRVDYDTLHAIYDGFVNSITQLHLFIMEQIRMLEAETAAKARE